jgi:hypothetical protein
MRRAFASAVALALIWGAAAIASPDKETYKGTIEGDEQAVVELRVEKGERRRAVTEFTVRKFPLECEGETVARLQRARLAGRAPVSRKGRFELSASNAAQRLRVKGRLGRGGTAVGTVTYSGETEFADAVRDCETAVGTRWTASR